MAMISRVIGTIAILSHETQGYSGKLSRSVCTQNATAVTEKTNSSLAVLATVTAYVSYWQ